MTTFYLTLATVGQNLFEGEVESVTCPGADGELTLLARHAPLISTLKKGTIIVRESADAPHKKFDINRGLLEVGHNKATILV